MAHRIEKVVAITGASGGIGEATAFLLAELGAKVVLGARREDHLRETVERIRRAGGEATFQTVDVTQRSQMTGLVTHACDQFGRLDVFINNAGIAPNSRMDAVRVDDWEAMIDVNLKGALYGIAAALPVFRQQGSGHIINILSTAGLVIRPTMGVYAGTKQAMRAITEGLRQEAGPDLRVTAISPGFVRTGLAQSMTDADARKSTETSMAEFAIAPDAIARAIAFAIEQPADVDVGEIVVRPTAQS